MTDSISDLLGDVYGNTKIAAAQPTAEDMAKQANVEFFNQLVTSRGIDITLLGDGEVTNLYKTAMEFKAKEEGKGKKDEKEEKEEAEKKEAAARVVAAANTEITEKRAAASKIAEAEFLGKVMAHSFAKESQAIAAKLAGEMPPQFGKKPEEKEEGKEPKNDHDEDDKKKKKEASDRAAALVAELSKVASTGGTPNLDELAAHRAIALLKEAGVDEERAFILINAEFVRGLPESTKIASTQTNEQALEVRALEFCEKAGFEVNWPQ